ncbi:MAG: 4Fe-4S ferredoxin, partial [Treponema sp.]|nr:4Fe-4S ferredoxin [Treponema sp.]
MKTYSFPRGGISLEDSTVPGADACALAFLPTVSVIPLVRHPGGRLKPLVREGDKVLEGMPVGQGSGALASVHATVPGTVERIARWEDGEGRPCEGVVIRMSGSFDKLGSSVEDAQPPSRMPVGFLELMDILESFGIVEMERTCRPLAALLSGFRRAPESKTLVARCVFDDPWLVAERALCAGRLDAVVEGAFLIAGACGAERVIFAVSSGEKRLGQAMLEKAAFYGLQSSMIVTGKKYPQRSEREMGIVLREHAKKSEAEPGSALFLGPSTLAAARDAVRLRQPVLERYVAVGGSAVKRPQVMRARIGKRLGDLFDECGGFSGEVFQVVSGSPFFGENVRYLDEPLTSSSYAIVAMLKSQTGARAARDCISCGECRRV